MAITYHAGRRIQGTSTGNTVNTPTTNDNATWITGTKINATVSSGNITFSGVGAIDAEDQITIESGASGYVTMKPKLGSGNHNTRLQLNLILASTTITTSTYQKYTWVFNTSGLSTRWTRVYVDGSEEWSNNTDWTAGNDTFKIEVDGTTVKFYHGSTLRHTESGATTGTYKISAIAQDAGNGEMNEVKTDGFSISSTNSDYNALTNVQVGSRFEETDTRKIYYRDDISFKELDGANATNYRSDSWYEQLSGETP